MASTAVERPAVVQRINTTDDVSNLNSANISPVLSATGNNSSSTSLSSMEETSLKHLDTHGNEFKLPDYTINDIRNAIPKHCFERSIPRSLGYVARDLVLLTLNFILFHNYIVPAMPNAYARFAAWALYAIPQGLFATGIWVLAHECGHQAFSPSKLLNDTVGWVLHSAVLVPYFSWKISHGKHHKATGHLDRDMVFVPKTRSDYVKRMGRQICELTEETPIATALHSLGQQLVGWPLYIVTNVTGHNKHQKQPEGRGEGKANGFFGGINHFNPNSPLYEAKDAKLILLSDLGFAITLFMLYLGAQKWGYANMAIWYGVPYLWVNHWLVAITFLQHTDPTLPHYDATAWNYTRGAAATIDRDFGFIGRHLLHGIIETHVAHHYISTIPFYHADEATEAIKKVMGSHYRSDTKDGTLGFLRSLWTSARWCQWVEETEGCEGSGVVFFRNSNGLGVKPASEKSAAKSKIVGNVI